MRGIHLRAEEGEVPVHAVPSNYVFRILMFQISKDSNTTQSGSKGTILLGFGLIRCVCTSEVALFRRGDFWY